MPEQFPHEEESYDIDDWDFGIKTVSYRAAKSDKIPFRILWVRFVNRWLLPWRRKKFDAELASLLNFIYAGEVPPGTVAAITPLEK